MLAGWTALSAPARIVTISDNYVAKIDLSETKEVAEIAMLRPLRAQLPPLLRHGKATLVIRWSTFQ
jgi:hypothetical protein